MTQKKLIFLTLLVAIFCTNLVVAQFKDFGIKAGLRGNLVQPFTEFENDNGLSIGSYIFDGFVRFELSRWWNAELGVGFGNLSGDDFIYSPALKKGTGTYSTTILPITAKILYAPWDLESWNPYFYAGIGVLNYSVGTKPSVTSVSPVEESGWTGIIPIGVGTEIKLSEDLLLDLNVGLNYSLTDNLNFFKIDEFNDAYLNVGVGIVYTKESLSSDKDKDGLTKGEELELGTDPNNPDTDGDGLNDGIEVKQYTTDPRKADTDGDGLKDGEEVLNYKTNPLKADTDADGLTDYDELMKFKTDPLKNDTDGDGLNDGDEVMKYKTDPLKVDTDGDGLKDGEEVLKYKTNPLKVDTDGGTIGDGVEVKRGSNPLDPADDVPVQFVEKEYSYKSVYFDFDKHNIKKNEGLSLDSTATTLSQMKDAKISLSGHADAIGSDKYNMNLSEKRVNIVKEYLVKKGLNGETISVEFFGESKPAADNKTAKGRSLNRRTEIKAKVMEKVK
jgi:outer membrane protein OmpA-like peptidoglycan-associated protein